MAKITQYLIWSKQPTSTGHRNKTIGKARTVARVLEILESLDSLAFVWVTPVHGYRHGEAVTSTEFYYEHNR